MFLIWRKRFTKKQGIIIVIASVGFALILVLTVYLVLFAPRKLTKELPQEQIVGVVRVVVSDDYVTETKWELSKENMEIFNRTLKNLKYVEWHNVARIKTAYFDREYYIITYENYTVRLSENRLVVFCGDTEQKKILFDVIKPYWRYKELANLFEN